MSGFLEWLRGRHAAITAIEEKGRQMVEAGNQAAYAALMREKAEIIMDLAEEAETHYPGLPENMRRKVASKLEGFSRSAATGLDLGSVFYMSALLYRDDHRLGEPDNLALCIAWLETMLNVEPVGNYPD